MSLKSINSYLKIRFSQSSLSQLRLSIASELLNCLTQKENPIQDAIGFVCRWLSYWTSHYNNPLNELCSRKLLDANLIKLNFLVFFPPSLHYNAWQRELKSE